jgi:hypothetical protein
VLDLGRGSKPVINPGRVIAVLRSHGVGVSDA